MSHFIFKATPLKYVREESFQEPVIKLNFNDFEASPSPEKKPSPKIERVDVEKPQTPETPAEKRKSRRRSSFFRKIEEVQEEQKVPERQSYEILQITFIILKRSSFQFSLLYSKL